MEQLDDEDKELLKDLWITDEKLDEEISKEWKVEEKVPLYGKLEKILSKEEEKLLLKPTKFTIHDKLVDKDFKKELEPIQTKIRYGRMTEPGVMEEKESDTEEMDEEEEEDVRMMEAETRETYDPINKTLNMNKKRATDICTNQRVIMPAPRPSKEECDLEVRTGLPSSFS